MPRAKKASKRKKTKVDGKSAPRFRGKIWLEVRGKPALTEAGADLLDQIVVCHSLSEAARRLRFAYRRAWLLVDAMNTLWPEPLVTKTTGGKSGGGTIVTPQGLRVLASYREMQIRVEHILGELHAS